MQNDFMNNLKLYWKLVRLEMKGNVQSACGVKNDGGEIVWDECEGREAWKKYFVDEDENENMETDDDVDVGVENEVNMEGMNDEVEEMSMKELIVDMSKLKSRKSPGVEQVIALKRSL
jgi:hypothetical protein